MKRAAAVTGVASLLLCLSLIGCTSVPERPAATPPRPAATHSDSTSEVGPYAIALVRARRIENPQLGPDLIHAPDLPDGYVLVDAHVRITNVIRPGRHPVKLVNTEGFTVVASDGTTYGPVGGTGIYNVTGFETTGSTAATGPAAQYGFRTGEMMNRMAKSGSSYTINRQFVVPASAEDLTLRFMPVTDQPAFLDFEIE